MATQENAEAIAPNLGTVPSFETEVNAVVSKMTQDEKGNYSLPQGEYSNEVRYAANAERRRRSTESALTKARQQLKAQQDATQKITQKIAQSAPLQLTPEQISQLSDLKHSDPDSWRHEVNKLEQQAYEATQKELDGITTEASQQAERASREAALVAFNQAHPETPITDDVVKFDIPPRITKRLETAETTFDEFLNECHDYLVRPRVLGGVAAQSTPNIGTGGGGSTPGTEAINRDTVDSYSNAVF